MFMFNAKGTIALADGRTDSATAYFRRANESWCEMCALYALAHAYDVGGQTDSTIAILEHSLGVREPFRYLEDEFWLPYAYKRLGELYDAKGNVERAMLWYGRFVELWKSADPELQPQVTAAKKRMRELAARRG
jgi:tetratricopeptide (TPR) repeat protein